MSGGWERRTWSYPLKICMFPVVPLAKGQALAIGLTSYDGGVYYGFNGDRDAMSDVDVLAGLVDESLDELLGTVAPS